MLRINKNKDLKKSLMAQLAQGDWINRSQNLLLTGSPVAAVKPILPARWDIAPACRVTVSDTIAYTTATGTDTN